VDKLFHGVEQPPTEQISPSDDHKEAKSPPHPRRPGTPCLLIVVPITFYPLTQWGKICVD
jgi:hypothetical protein